MCQKGNELQLMSPHTLASLRNFTYKLTDFCFFESHLHMPCVMRLYGGLFNNDVCIWGKKLVARISLFTDHIVKFLLARSLVKEFS